MANNPRLRLHLVDGARRPLAPSFKYLVRLVNGHQREVHGEFYSGPPPVFELETFHDNFGDQYTVIVSARKHHDAAFAPVKVARERVEELHLMLLPKRSRYDFSRAFWSILRETDGRLTGILRGEASEQAAEARYDELLDGGESMQNAAATLHNIATALSQVALPAGDGPLDYYRELIWEPTPRPDRFFAFVDPALLAQLDLSAAFANAFGHTVTHPGSTRSLKQTKYGEANVQLTFYENDRKEIGGRTCIRVEADIDYFKDPLAHFFLELIPNAVTRGKTNPKIAYLLRWIAGQRAGGPEFAPPYAIVPAT